MDGKTGRFFSPTETTSIDQAIVESPVLVGLDVRIAELRQKKLTADRHRGIVAAIVASAAFQYR